MVLEMMAHSFTGRSVLFIRRFVLLALISASPLLQTASADDYDIEISEALASADAAWARSLLLPDAENTPFDEQIFTELSPILDSPQGVKLPEDQLLQE